MMGRGTTRSSDCSLPKTVCKGLMSLSSLVHRSAKLNRGEMLQVNAKSFSKPVRSCAWTIKGDQAAGYCRFLFASCLYLSI